jgi:hypothetical protein
MVGHAWWCRHPVGHQVDNQLRAYWPYNTDTGVTTHGLRDDLSRRLSVPNVSLQRPVERKSNRAGFPYIVEMAVPEGGLGKRLDTMHEWHRATVADGTRMIETSWAGASPIQK